MQKKTLCSGEHQFHQGVFFFSAEHYNYMLNILVHYVNVYNTYPTFQANY